MKRWIACLLLLSCLCMLSCAPVSVMASGTVRKGHDHDRVIRFLLMGCDRSTSLTDSILLITVDQSQNTASILQIPRDTYAAYTEKSYKKLNGARNALGEKGFKSFLSETLGVPIHYFVVIKLDFFRKVVDAIGGVELEIPQDMTYEDPEQGLAISLRKGKTRLNGDMAEQFVRYRSGYVNADLGRLDAQKLFLRAFAKQCRALSPADVIQITAYALTGVQTDLGIADAIRVMRTLLQCDPDTVPMATMTGQAVQGNSGAWYYVLNREGACRLVNEYLLPPNPIETEQLDPNGLFDRPQNEIFHRIYRTREAELPIL